ncbi:MAG: hypothetical protein ACOX2W_00495 [Desulfomonilia bacterium]|jgi:hypothetical protein
MNRFKKIRMSQNSVHIAMFQRWSDESALSAMQGLTSVRALLISGFLRALGDDTAIAVRDFSAGTISAGTIIPVNG